MAWYEEEIAHPMGFQYCVLFESARSAMAAYPGRISLPLNICPQAARAIDAKVFQTVSDETGLAPDVACHLYGYQSPATRTDIAIDPLMTGWIRQLKAASAIISFGLKKMISIGYGGAFLTNDQSLAEEMRPKAHWNNDYTDLLRKCLPVLKGCRIARFDIVDTWDRYLGDTLIRIPQEQIMPWRVMRRAYGGRLNRDNIVRALREGGIDVGTNYPPLTGLNTWGATVLNFSCSSDLEKTEIQRACGIIKRVVRG